MVLYKNSKFACISCIRGHRSSTCEHTDRVLLHVRKPGRKSSTDPKSRIAIVKKEHSSSPKSRVSNLQFPDEFVTIKVPEDQILDSEGIVPERLITEEETPTHDDVVFTKKYVFTHVGENLFKRENIEEYKKRVNGSSCCQKPTNGDPPCHENFEPKLPNLEHPVIDDQIASALENPRGDRDYSPFGTPAPIVIAPMQYQDLYNHNSASLLNKIGVSEEEAHQLWPGYVNEMDMLYVPDCAIPGRCKCGDGCKCIDCYEHNNGESLNPKQ